MLYTETIAASAQIYKNGAIVTRSGSVRLSAGTNRIIIRGMTNSAVHSSLRMQFPASVTASDIQVRNLRNESDEVSDDNLNDDIAILEQKIKALDTEAELLRENGVFTQREGAREEEVISYLSALPDRLGAVYSQKRILEKDLKQKKKELEKFQKDICLPVIEAVLTAEADMEQCPFTLQYQDPAVSWEPRYEIHYLGEESKLTVKMCAKIIQKTGEDWNDISVSLFTGNPALAGTLPDPQPLRMGLYIPPNPVHYSAGARASASPARRIIKEEKSKWMSDSLPLGTMSGDTADVPLVSLTMPASEEETHDTMSSYELPVKKTIASGTAGNMSDLHTYAVRAVVKRVAYPQHGNFAWLAAEIAVSDWPVPDAPAAIYLDGTYAGVSVVAPDRTKDTFLLSLGADERIQVKREKISDHISDVFLRGRKMRKTSYRIHVSGSFAEKTDVEIHDQIPVSADKSIEIEPDSSCDGTVRPETGEVIWNVSVSRDMSVEKELSYSITWPKDQTIQELRQQTRSRRFCLHCGSEMQTNAVICPHCGMSAY